MKIRRKKIINKVKLWIIGSAVALVVGISGLIVSKLAIDVGNNTRHSYENVMTNGYDSKSNNVSVTYQIPVRSDGVRNCWEDKDNNCWGAQYDFYINNYTEDVMKKWSITLKIPSSARIDSSWNGVFTQKDNKIVIVPMEKADNREIPSDSDIRVGFVLYTEDLLNTINYVLEYNLFQNFLLNPCFVFFLCLSGTSFLLFTICIVLYFLLKKQDADSDAQIMELVKLCARFIDTRDPYTRMHSAHVAEYSKRISRVLGYDSDFQEHIFFLGMLHDIGKVLIPREILCKPAKLNDEEWEEMKNHTIYGAEVLGDFNGIENIREAALYHHERYDGTGYVNGLKGEAIPLEARIICVADAYDAMATDRSYRKHLNREKILEELEKGKGSQFDPKIADAMIKLIESNEIIC